MTTSETRTVKTVEHPGHWATLRIDNPPVNVLDDRVYGELVGAFERFEADPGMRVVVLESADPDFFAAHFDVALTPEQNTAAKQAYARLMTALRSPRLVSIAKIRGRARGGGNELALQCDMRFASAETAIIGQPEIIGRLFPGGGALQLLPALIGRSRALEMILSGRDIDAATAERYGVINRAVPDTELDEFVDTLAARIAGFDPIALQDAKAAVDRRYLPTLEDLLYDVEAFNQLLESPETVANIRDQLAAGLQTRGPLEYNLGS
ncbi:enoyl-CoA hydratase/isomerase family protein [Nocardia terpenica]|uniref:Enoyl-CoA hydratase/isomerase family protein n=1 Tax=Nocardia terpenica TaxID=455432 RepID=A0A6G9Z6D3_9NOCA|nr:enoyl-CoA hydratase/isomerase family protein [Nocardia terpenica]QIS21149.1 enoyl-CoA hydratase/isomerase family protein [Nocardia terpenica]